MGSKDHVSTVYDSSTWIFCSRSNAVNNYKFMTDDLTNRIGEFGAKHFGVSVENIACDDTLFEAATKLFWDHYFDSEVEL